jgi:hypothetical protein
VTPIAAYRRLSRQLFFDLTDMYLVWCRHRTSPDALWADMPYAPRSREGCIQLIESYKRRFGDTYEYEIHQVGFSYPQGMRSPCFVGHM